MTVEVSRRTPADAGTHVSLGGRLSALAARIRAALDATSVAILIVDVDARKTRLIAEAGLGKAALGRQYPLDGGVSGRAISTGEPVVTDDKDARLVVEHAPREELSAAAVPIRSGEAVDGAICVVMGDPQREFDARDIALLECAAEAAGTSLDLEAADRRAAGAAEATVSVLSELADLRDGYVAADAREVVRLAAAIGARMGISDVALDDLSFAARVHDIGKIGVPDHILHKAGTLNEDERVVMQRHALWGAQTLDRLPGLERVAAMVRSHHERWDGLGYPVGASGDAIPLESRIIGVCDAYRAMTSDRPYRNALPPERALALVKSGAGTLFDPGVVDRLEEVLGDEGITAAGDARRGNLSATVGADQKGKGASRLWAAVGHLDSLPVMAESRQRVLELLSEPTPASGRIVEVVEADIALTAAALRIANAAAGDAKGRIGSVPQAVAALGPEGVHLLISGMEVTDFFERRAGWAIPPNRFRLHALAVRDTVLALERATGFGNRDELVAAAMLHDVGKLVLADAQEGYPDRYHAGVDAPDERVRIERRALGLDHAAVGAIALRRWGVPETLARAVEAHHVPSADGMAALLRLADLLAHFAHGAPITPRALVDAAQAVDLDEVTLRSLMYELSAGNGDKDRRSVDPSPLTHQETLALRGLAQGQMYKEIAEAMGLSTSTVRSHLHKAYGKLGVPDRAQAVLVATDRGWI
jgi:putative nucleotidyltransferase with HDIG domain